MNKHAAGLRGQAEAEAFLTARGGEILARNYRTRTGEIDIIVRDGEYIAFVEVKFRAGLSHGFPAEAVGSAKQKKIIRTALHFIAAKGLDNQDFRFDVIEILEQNGRRHLNYIENAFGL